MTAKPFWAQQREREWDLAHERSSGNARHDGDRN